MFENSELSVSNFGVANVKNKGAVKSQNPKPKKETLIQLL